MAKGVLTFASNHDPRELPAYGIREVSHYLGIPETTLRSWVVGRYYPAKGGKSFFRPILSVPRERPLALSFLNLVEAHVLDAIRRDHNASLARVRRALEYLKRRFPSRHPLADQKFETDGLSLFVEKYGQLINISREGQLAIRGLLQSHLRRIERDRSGLAAKLYPFTRKHQPPGRPEEPRVVVIDPYVSFGRPVLAGTGIAIAVIAERYKAGESIDELAADYGRQRSQIEEAIRCELHDRAA